MNKWLLMASTAAVAAVATFFVLNSDYNPFVSPMTRACEVVLKKRLLAPAGYKRVEITENSEPLSLDDYLKDRNTTSESERLLWTRMYNDDIVGKNPPTKFTLFISYDAPNAYGTPVRGLSMCEYRSISASKSNAAWYSVIVDNFTQTGWLKDQLVKGNLQN
ncbi:hypothetical protein NKJ87_19025 [Mesorhizobium sp. M0027]|uniref:hypothetical protein n=1 Tax=Mesorhizobium sp. M0027 TaxID=2956848 RepID=UPI00333BF659